MLLSFIPGIFAQVFRGLRWRQTLEPLNEKPRRNVCINAVFISYASSLVVPRIGEMMRCGILKKHEGTSFSKALGTVVTERVVDSALVLLLNIFVLVYQLPVILRFFNLTGIGMEGFFSRFTTVGIFVTLICTICILGLGFYLIRHLALAKRLKSSMNGLWSGITSLKKVHNIPLYTFYSIGIWVSYFLHYYLTFYCFDFTENLGFTAGLVSFCIGTIAVIVPTPNGAGSWHFAVKTILVLYGLQQLSAVAFVFIVHSVQTLLLIFLGVYALFALQFFHPANNKKEVES